MHRARRNRIQSAPDQLDRVDGPLHGLRRGSPAHLRLVQQEHLDYWAAFWKGLDEESNWIRQNQQGNRRQVYELYTVPKRRSWTPDDPDRDPARPRMRHFGPRPRRLVPYHVIQSMQSPERLRRADGEIMSGENPMMTPLQPLGFRFRKTLGQGGGGLAVLVDLLDQNGKADEWVIKAPIGRGTLSREARNMRLMVGARHIVQRKFIKVPDRNLPSDHVSLNTDRPDCVIGMELMKHGSLDGLLRKMCERNLKLRDDELWMIFHCLFRACVAMSRPGTWGGGFNPERDPIPLRDEDIPLSLVIWCMLHDPASRPDFDQLDSIIVGNLRNFQQDGDPNTQDRTAISDILTTPPPPPSLSLRQRTSATLAAIAGDDGGGRRPLIPGSNPGAAIRHVRWTPSGWQALDGGSVGLNQQPAVPGPPRRQQGRPGFRAAARTVFRPVAGTGGGLRNLARRAGRGIRRVVGGAVRRVTGTGTGTGVGPRRQTQAGNATVSRPADQQADGGRGSAVDLQLAIAFSGLAIPGGSALAGARRNPP
ncbi:hypothetical protein DHEL01_v209608 [Diaporthe helianthi]|uniref:Protein kinase domain-containing protein n=1 Tax=Diaporthe helianthi TaxID=158607 RepID=A0A2P5HP26_DIAHE|nr:hypothetical protein DHEL01_v209608 [Diaporthe helianthi]